MAIKVIDRIAEVVTAAQVFAPYVVKIWADFPNADMLNLLTLPSEGGSINGILNLLDAGSVDSRIQFGALAESLTYVVSVGIYASNPNVRDTLGSRFETFFKANPWAGGKMGEEWEVSRVRNNGYLPVVSGIYGRGYTLWVNTTQTYEEE